MLSKATQNKLALYFSAMIALHGYVLWQARQSIPQGLPDFSIFYTAGRIVRDGHGGRLYDDALQESVQREFSPRALERRGSILPYNHPPFEAVLFVPSSFRSGGVCDMAGRESGAAVLDSTAASQAPGQAGESGSESLSARLPCIVSHFCRSDSRPGFYFAAVPVLPGMCRSGAGVRACGGNLARIRLV